VRVEKEGYEPFEQHVNLRTDMTLRARLEKATSALIRSATYNESLSGDLSNSTANPAPLTFGLGANQVIGSIFNNRSDVHDSFIFQVGGDKKISHIGVLKWKNGHASLDIKKLGNDNFVVGSVGPLAGMDMAQESANYGHSLGPGKYQISIDAHDNLSSALANGKHDYALEIVLSQVNEEKDTTKAVTQPKASISYLSFVEGNPGVPGDNKITYTPGMFRLDPKLTMASIRDGMTLLFYVADEIPLIPSDPILNFRSSSKPTKCQLGMAPERGRVVSIPPSNGSRGFAVIITQDTLDHHVVDNLRNVPGCAYITLDDLVLDSIGLSGVSNGRRFNIKQIDAFAFKTGHIMVKQVSQ
jgi:hypothetical protein